MVTQVKLEALTQNWIFKSTEKQELINSVGANSIGKEAEMFLKADVQGIDAHLLIDTEATLTLVPTAFVEKIVDKTKTIPNPMLKRVYDVGGKTIYHIFTPLFRGYHS
jgi:hypothetical protein